MHQNSFNRCYTSILIQWLYKSFTSGSILKWLLFIGPASNYCPSFCHWLTHWCWNLNAVTLIGEDTNSIYADNASRDVVDDGFCRSHQMVVYIVTYSIGFGTTLLICMIRCQKLTSYYWLIWVRFAFGNVRTNLQKKRKLWRGRCGNKEWFGQCSNKMHIYACVIFRKSKYFYSLGEGRLQMGLTMAAFKTPTSHFCPSTFSLPPSLQVSRKILNEISYSLSLPSLQVTFPLKYPRFRVSHAPRNLLLNGKNVARTTSPNTDGVGLWH